jgi:hypothetical protein
MSPFLTAFLFTTFFFTTIFSVAWYEQRKTQAKSRA